MNSQNFFQSLLQGRRQTCAAIIFGMIALSLMMNVPLRAQTNSAERQFQQGLALLQARQYDDAIAAFTAALKLQPKHEQAYQKRVEAYQQKITQMLDTGKYEEAARLSQTVLETAIRQDDLKARSKMLNLLGSSHYELGNYPLALETLEKSLEAARKVGERTFQAEALNGMGVIYRSTSQYQKAVEFLERAAAIYRELSNNAGLGRALSNLGDVHTEQSEFDQAVSFYEQALPLLRETGNRRNEAGTLGSMAAVYAYQGNYSKSLELDKTVLKIYRELGDRGGEANQLGNIAATHLEMGNYGQALQYLQQSLTIATELKDKYVQQIQLSNLGNVYYHLGDYTRALDAFQQAQRIAQEMGNAEADAINLGGIGGVQNDLGQTVEALHSFEQAVQTFEKSGNKRGQAIFSANIAAIHTLAGRYAEAQPYFERALKFHQEIENPFGVAETYNGLGVLRLKTGDYSKSREAHEKALAMGNELKAARIIWEAQYGLAKAAEGEGKFAEAKKTYLQAIAGVEAARGQLPAAEQRGYFLANRTEIYKSLIHLLWQMRQREPRGTLEAEAFYYAEKAKARALLDLLAEAKIDLEQSLTQGQKNPVSAHLKYPQPLSLAEAQQKILGRNELALAYSLGEERSYLWAITARRHFFFQLPPEREIEKAARAYVSLLNDPRKISAPHLVPSRELYNLILLPADSLVQRTEKIIMIPDGILHNVPFEALVLPTKDRRPKYLIQHAEITYAPSATVLALLNAGGKTSPARAPKTLLAFADPFFGEDESQQNSPPKRGVPDSLTLRGLYDHLGVKFPRLNSAGAEVDSIARFFAPNLRTIYRRNEATEEHIKQDNLQRYAILHFATHALLFEEHPERSCIVLALDENPAEDGFLQMSEIYNLKLNAELVALSACQTAQGKLVRGEGLVSLGRAFLYAGAKSVLGILWSVADDPASAKLMGGFYDYLQQGKSRGAALRLAKLDLINGRTAPHRHPFYWAAFVLMGSAR